MKPDDAALIRPIVQRGLEFGATQRAAPAAAAAADVELHPQLMGVFLNR